MNRRAFIKLLSAAAMVPVIGLPAIATGAPAAIKVPWARYYCTYSYTKAELAGLDAKMKKAMDEMVFKPPYSGPQTLTVTVSSTFITFKGNKIYYTARLPA